MGIAAKVTGTRLTSEAVAGALPTAPYSRGVPLLWKNPRQMKAVTE
jgi:hypothetical protein